MQTRSMFYLFFLVSLICYGQKATIKEEIIALNTYGFDKPNPVPILTDNAKIFPYFIFEEYQHEAVKKNWKVVTLENDYIKVMILPEIGGKVWGAIEKSTGEEFLYKNKVVKFRNISMRGPWTSGGIEFNFGIIGHHPSTATPVNYVVKNNKDGSVSCVVGNADLPSNTNWRVEIRLEKDKAYFETNASWYNASPLNQSYYNWMTAAAVVSDDLEFVYPGNKFLEHGGKAKPWPIDNKGRDLSLYRNNNFDVDVSEHVVGDYKDFFGGYYHSKKFGFGHWAPYEEMPGQKLWLWSSARSGGIWEDLLTDTDGQYMEFQAGRLLNQYFPGERNPISQANFEPYIMDRWNEIWFPYKEIGGMEAVSKYGVLNVEKNGKGIYIGLNALQKINEELKVYSRGQEIFSKKINLSPMEVFSKELDNVNFNEVEVILGNKKLYYTSNKKKTILKRPFSDDEQVPFSKNQELYANGWEAMKYRKFDSAYSNLTKLVALDPSHQDGLAKLAELEYRRTNYEEALQYVNSALKLDTYNVDANYMAGTIYRAKKDYVNALESLGWAARSIKYRSVAYAQMAEIYLLLRQEDKAYDYAQKALNYNRYNLNAKYVELVLTRKNGQDNKFNKLSAEILEIDPLNHFVAAEEKFRENESNITIMLQNEFPEETVLQLAIYYYSIGYFMEAKRLLETNKISIKSKLWLAFIEKNINPKRSETYLNEVLAHEINFVFPYRMETISVLEWALLKKSHWKLRYYLGQNYLAIGKEQKGKQLLRDCENAPYSDVFYRFRAKILNKNSYESQLGDYLKALELNGTDWKIYDEIIQFYLANNKQEKAYRIASKAYKKFPKNSNIALGYAKSLLNVKRYNKTVEVLKKINILPFEHASESKKIYNDAHIFLAYKNILKNKYESAVKLLKASKEWPENLGVGKPHFVDARKQDYLLAECYRQLGNKEKSNHILSQISDFNNNNSKLKGIHHLYGLLAMKKQGKEVEVKNYISKLKKMNTNKWAKIALAFFLNNQEEISQLKLKKEISAAEYSLIDAVLKF